MTALSQAEVQRRRDWVRLCGTCKTPFGWSKNGDHALYCGRKCAGVAVGRQEKQIVRLRIYTCQTCSKQFANYYDDRKFCSRECSGHARRGRSMPYGTGGSTDKNQPGIVAALRKAGASVMISTNVARGFPDLVAAYKGINLLIEVKNRGTGYGRKGLNKNQLVWASEWKGPPVFVVSDIKGALSILAFIDSVPDGESVYASFAKIKPAEGFLKVDSADLEKTWGSRIDVINSVEEALALLETVAEGA